MGTLVINQTGRCRGKGSVGSVGRGVRGKIGVTSLRGESTSGGSGERLQAQGGGCCKKPSPEVGAGVEYPRTVGWLVRTGVWGMYSEGAQRASDSVGCPSHFKDLVFNLEMGRQPMM